MKSAWTIVAMLMLKLLQLPMCILSCVPLSHSHTWFGFDTLWQSVLSGNHLFKKWSTLFWQERHPQDLILAVWRNSMPIMAVKS